MIPDWQTNKVFFSYQSVFDFKSELKELRTIISQNNFSSEYIAGTKDYYCRDYMPVQIERNELVQFNFHPDYLLEDQETRKFVTDTKEVHNRNGFLKDYKIKFPDIILDGGNVIRSSNSVIITDKVAEDNQTSIENIRRRLEGIFKAKVIIIPRYPGEETGHADGLVRFVNENTVLSINLDDELPKWKEQFISALKDAKLNIISLPKGMSPEMDWRYINYLQVSRLIIAPFFGNKSDEIILPFMRNLFEKENYKMETINAAKIAESTGVLNCFSWNLLT